MAAQVNILLLSGYHAASHRYWAEQLIQELPEFNWHLLSLPDRHFYWRIRSNALSFAFQHPELQSDQYDLLIATSMVDLCNLRGLLPHLSTLPTVLYFHENQFAYPQQKPNSNLVNAQLTTVYSALAADALVFNSVFNRDSFICGARELFKKMPDGTPADLLDYLPDRSAVIPVPVKSDFPVAKDRNNNQRIEIVWNHRWEYDKQPQVFFAAIELLIENGYQLSLHVMGQSFREVPECFSAFRDKHADVISTWGYQSLDDYRRILSGADIVVSAALHDFQGLGMLEGIAAGCIPIAPDRMAYPEYIPEDLLYPVDVPDNEEQEVQALYEKLAAVIDGNLSRTVDVSRYTQSEVLPVYRDLVLRLIG